MDGRTDAGTGRRRRPRGHDPLQGDGEGQEERVVGRSREPVDPRDGTSRRPAGVGDGWAHGHHDRGRHQRPDVHPGQRLLRREPQVLGLRRDRHPGAGEDLEIPLHPGRRDRAAGCGPARGQGHVGHPGGAQRRAEARGSRAERLFDRPRGRKPRAVRRDPGRLRSRGVEERVRRGDGEEEAEGGGDRARDEGAASRRSPRHRPGRRRHRARPEDRSFGALALRVRHAARRDEPLQDRRASDQELHDEPDQRGPLALGGPEAARGLRPSRAPVQRVRHAPLPHAGDSQRRSQGHDHRRARIRRLVGRRLDHRPHGSPERVVAQQRARPRVSRRERVRVDVWLGDGVRGEGLHHEGAARLRPEVGRREGRAPAHRHHLPPQGLRKHPRRRDQTGRGEAGRGREGLRDLHDEGRGAARPRPSQPLGGDARHLHLGRRDDGIGQPRPSDGDRATGPHQSVRW